MVAITDSIKDNTPCRTMKQDNIHQTARIIQWLGGERAVDVPDELNLTSSYKEDVVDHHIVASKVECIELLRLKPLSKQDTNNTFERGSLYRRSSRRHLNRSSPDAQTIDEAYYTLSSNRSAFGKKRKSNQKDLVRQGSTSGSSTVSTAAPHCTSSPILTVSVDDIYTTLDRAQHLLRMDEEHGHDEFTRLRSAAQQNSFRNALHSIPMLTQPSSRSMDLFRQMLFSGEHGERDFKDMVEEFIKIIESKLSDAQCEMFDSTAVRASSPSLFDMLNDLKTCLELLRRTEMQSLLTVFDSVLKMHLYPSALPEHEDRSSRIDDENNTLKLNNSDTTEELLKLAQYGIDELKIVKIEKAHEPLGLTISRSDSGTIHIARIVVGGIAGNTQLFQVNDRILEINDEPMTGRSLDYVCSLMSHSTGLIKFLLAPPLSPMGQPSSMINIHQMFYVRALYGYDPSNDPLIPCQELGLTFQRGDILRIVAREDHPLSNSETAASWWQAYRENSGETDTDPTLAGLIPSDILQQKRTALLKALTDETESVSSISMTSILKTPNRKRKPNKTCFTCVPKQERKMVHSVYNNATFVRENDDTEAPTIRTSTNHFSLTDTRRIGEERLPNINNTGTFNDENKYMTLDSTLMESLRFYEPVFRLDMSTHSMTRPIVLLGAPNVGRHELRRRLLQSEPHLFDVAIPHTTRARRLHEVPDVDYHFVSEADFLAKVSRHSFVEFGQYDRDLYGTSIEDIRHVVQEKKKICILNLNPDAIRTFDRTDLYPFIVCIAAPSFERLKRLELDRRDHLTDNDYREIIRQSRSLERHHCLLFDTILINNDLDRTYAELRDLIVRIQHDDQQWVRACYRRT